ncbi:MAG: hypothetical protein HY719_03050 [Planctomycetes bacterium]|nr:hypothetical protein [Planctomycetota bacterium]
MEIGEIVRDILLRNEAFTRRAARRYRAAAPFVQQPRITVLAPSDSGMQTDVLGMESTGRLYVVRNATGQVEGNLGSLDLGVLVYRTPVALVLGHTNSDALKMAVNRALARQPRRAGKRRSVTRVMPQTLAGGAGEPAPTDPMEQEMAAFFAEIERLLPAADKYDVAAMQIAFLAQSHVDLQVAKLAAHYGDLVSRGKLVVIGAVHDENGAFTDVFGRVIITNINGRTDPPQVRAHAAAIVGKLVVNGGNDPTAARIEALIGQKVRRI